MEKKRKKERKKERRKDNDNLISSSLLYFIRLELRNY
jgi:hypothetical protein